MKYVKKYVPKQGDIVFLDFNSTKGHEQKGQRPAIVLSNNVFNQNTTNEKYFPTHYNLEDSKNIHGSVLCEHIRSINL